MQPRAKYVLARYSSELIISPEVHVSGRCSIKFDGEGLLASTGRASLKFSGHGSTSQTSVSGRASLGFGTGAAQFGLDGRASLRLQGHGAVSAQEIVRGRASLVFGTGRFVHGSASLRFSARGAVSFASTSTKKVFMTNIATGETTEVPAYDFIRFVELGHSLYGVKSDGLYLIESGSTAAGSPIAASAKTHPSDFESPYEKHVPYIYVTTPNTVDVIPTCDSAVVGTYTSDVGKQRVRLARGAKGFYWAFEFKNVSGNALKIDFAEPLVHQTSRRV